jgi:hypothetical protein
VLKKQKDPINSIDMTEELITFETAKLAKKKGFDEACRFAWEWYKNDGKEYGPTAVPNADIPDLSIMPRWQQTIMAERRGLVHHYGIINSHLPQWLFARPTQDLLERWLREKQGLMPGQIPIVDNGRVKSFLAVVPKLNHIVLNDKINQTEYTTFELAREAAIYHALTLIP